jgi:hypothetical protein
MSKTPKKISSGDQRAMRARASARELPMSIEYLLVSCPTDCAVFADGNGVGFTNHVLMLPADEYMITIDKTPAPPGQDVVLAATSIVRPKVISFE